MYIQTTGTTMKTTPAVVVGDLRRGAKARLPNSPPKHNILDILGFHDSFHDVCVVAANCSLHSNAPEPEPGKKMQPAKDFR